MVGKPRILGRSTFAYLDAGERATRVYTDFLMKVPRDFAGVNQVLYRAASIVVQERGPRGRELSIPVNRLF